MDKKYLNLKYWIIIITLILLGLSLLYFKETLFKGKDSETLKQFFEELASAIIIAGIFSIINEKFLRESLIEVIINKVHLKTNLDKIGIKEILTDIGDIPYKDLIEKSNKNIDIAHVYGRTWTNSNWDEIKNVIRKKNKLQLRVLLIDTDSDFIIGLANHYNLQVDELKKQINDIIQQWKQLKSSYPKANIKIYLHKGLPSCSIYRFDDIIVNIQSKMAKERSKYLPTIICSNTKKDSDMFNTIANDIANLVKQSKEV